MHLYHHSSFISFKTTQQNAFLLATAKKEKAYRLFQSTTSKIIISRDMIFAENAAQPLVDYSKGQFLNQPNAFDTLLPLLQNVVFEGDRLTKPHGGNFQALH